jgi:hypothetical protein
MPDDIKDNSFKKKCLKVIGIIIVIYVISIISKYLGIFFFENILSPESVESQEDIGLYFFVTLSVLYYTFATKKFKVLKYFIGFIVFISLLIFFIEMGLTEEVLDKYLLLIIGGLIPVVLIVFAITYVKDKSKQCAWCGSLKIKFKSGNEGDWYWEYRNKDGSKDKRVKDNFQQSDYNSEFECNECSATTKFKHLVDKKPSENVEVWKRTLVTEGNNDRKGTNWESSSMTTIHKNQANRKS